MGHTPGPFEVADSTEIIAWVPSPTGKGYDILTIARCSDVEIYNDDRAGKTADNVALLAAAPDMLEALKCLARIADAYDDNGLDDEARKTWGKNDEHHNTTPPERIELYSGRGGKRLLTLADCLQARAVINKAEGK